jgi:hypothetical protein
MIRALFARPEPKLGGSPGARGKRARLHYKTSSRKVIGLAAGVERPLVCHQRASEAINAGLHYFPIGATAPGNALAAISRY